MVAPSASEPGRAAFGSTLGPRHDCWRRRTRASRQGGHDSLQFEKRTRRTFAHLTVAVAHRSVKITDQAQPWLSKANSIR
mgnify:CR=1 FL=1|jgi:hypothetical protein